jgi:uncharacterized protein YcnI
MRIGLFSVVAAVAFAGAAHAHVTVMPTVSQAGARETYTFSVPTEGASPTTGVELEAPAGVSILSVEGPSSDYEVERTDGRIVKVRWRVQIPPGEGRELILAAQNPSAGEEIAWKVHQRFADGSQRDWVDAPKTRQPAPRTRLSRP